MKTLEKAALVTVLAVSTSLLSGCGRDKPVRVCSDIYGNRLADSQCGATGSYGSRTSGGHASWVYIPGRGYDTPPVGGRISGGSALPESGVRYGAAPEGGISRGGFGGIGAGGHGGGE